MSTEGPDGSAAEPDRTAVEFYTRPGCPFSALLRKQLARKRVPLREIDIWDDRDAAATVRAVAGGNETVPTVFVGGHAMVNPGSREVLEAVRTYAPGILPEQPRQEHRSRWWPPWR
ncbi:NrdH-redoxin [Haloechinothrix sp. YIM 98757]|uniref:NrdH-redoxin n=1 Tax=Haloechinothrix aidingensis TaxID=2752311 RepID=A0A838A062_9PSEU|nr:glutaredoxin domain-containing protein [Haloechinothrix aidingensis]MBA0124453.1 NrdH-redoxin [Haloechinothrix aidingensis]